MSSSPNREKILLNLKWFVHRMVKSFEVKLLHTVSPTSNSVGRISPNSSSLSPLLWCPGETTYEPDDAGELSLLRQLLEDQIRQGKRKASGKDSLSQNDLAIKKNTSNRNERSPLVKIRSLTNSPLFRRFSHSSGQNKTCLLSKSDQMEFPAIRDTGIYDNKLCTKMRAQSNPVNDKCNSSPQSPTDFSAWRKAASNQKTYIAHFFDMTSEVTRQKQLSAFAQQLCIVYEYQIGMLRGLNSIHSAADYVVDVILKALKLGKITNLSFDQLTPEILFDADLRPSTYSKCVKTCPLAVTNEQLNWRLGEMWTLPGLRHNEVGGENCHNLSIVTHFLSTSITGSGASRSDIYGYRNLILLMKHRSEESDLDDHSTDQENRQLEGEKLTGKPRGRSRVSEYFFDIIPTDYLTISGSKVRVGSRHDTPDSPNSAVGSSSAESTKNSQQTLQSHASPEGNTPHASRKTTVSSGTSTIRQHLHRAYRPVFFVIFNRPSVIEHLTECDSFAAFCRRQSLSPVMFLNQTTRIFDEKLYPCIFQNFDLFTVTVAGYTSSSSMQKTVPFADVSGLQPQNVPHSVLSGSRNPLLCFPYLSQHHLAAYDNPGFAR
ncbi:hypothetical protein FGIG_06081 [Fasciola gigantica]|uniref:Uncharacterized protein n=1 Tax=Fasciola gigantica TaxID=46835 RepID=A0A504YZ93_FASGI|nr:hypothetical protein FGIG_06081 [Fasciola gigantica]